MKFEIPSLPFPKDALEPRISARTIDFHYEKHHKGYLNKLRKAIEGTAMARQSLDEIVRTVDDQFIFNQAAQVWNHNFYWKSLAPTGMSPPAGKLGQAIERDFGGFDKLKRELAEIANGQFGSGWAWLVTDRDGKLRVTSTSDADNPVPTELKPLLTIDVWEHAYYLDYQHERAKYVEAVIDGLISWKFAENNYAGPNG